MLYYYHAGNDGVLSLSLQMSTLTATTIIRIWNTTALNTHQETATLASLHNGQPSCKIIDVRAMKCGLGQ